MALDNLSYQSFDVSGEPASVGSRWEKWLRGFKRFAIAKGIKDDVQLKNLLLVCAGQEVQDLYDGLHSNDSDDNSEEEGEDEGTPRFQATVDLLTSHFVPQVNVPFERHLFKQMSPDLGESILKFIARLKARAQNCEFNDIDDQIRDQVIHTVKSDILRRKLLECGKNLTLEKLKEIAITFEAVENQMAAMSLKEVNKLSYGSSSKTSHGKKFSASKNAKPNPNNNKSNDFSRKFKSSNGKCFRCGHSGHFSKDSKCPAWGKTCMKCKGKDHFSSVCRSKHKQCVSLVHNSDTSTNVNSQKVPKVPQDSFNKSMNDDENYAFYVSDVNNFDNSFDNYAFMVSSDVGCNAYNDYNDSCEDVGYYSFEDSDNEENIYFSKDYGNDSQIISDDNSYDSNKGNNIDFYDIYRYGNASNFFSGNINNDFYGNGSDFDSELIPKFYTTNSLYDGINKNESHVNIELGGIMVEMMIDSGASANIIDENLWQYLKSKNIKCASTTKVDKPLYRYGSSEPLKVLGKFKCQARLGTKELPIEIIVYKGKAPSILSRKTSIEFGILKMGLNINNVSCDKSQKLIDDCCKGIGKLKNFQLKLHIDSSVKPVVQSQRRLPFALREKVSKKLYELLDTDIIESVNGPTPWVSPLVIIPKNDDVRICIDMRQANKAIVRERHPIPTLDEVLIDLNRSTIFTKLDIKSAFHQIELDEESRGITTFVSHLGLFRYKRLMFGISSATEKYQQIMQQVLQGTGAVNIIDDVVVHGANQQEHDKMLINVLKRLKECGMTLNKEKCKFNLSKIKFFGLVLSERGIGPAEEKVSAVIEARKPKDATELRSFLGLVNYSGRFIPNLATISDPLRRLTKKNVSYNWGKEQDNSYNELKVRLANHVILGYFKPNHETKLIVDASPVGLGAVLVQNQVGEDRVIHYASRSLSDTERKYSQTEKEALAVVWGCERFHIYLYGIKFLIISDHKPLEVIYSAKSKPSARIERWVLRLQSYDFKVVHESGKSNIADPLSRLLPETKKEKDRIDYVNFVVNNAIPKAMTRQEIELNSETDCELKTVRDCINNNLNWDKCGNIGFKAVKDELCVLGNLVLRGTRIVLPKVLRPKAMCIAHEGHPGIVVMKQLLRSKVWWPGIDAEAEKYCKSCHGCQLVSRPDPVEPMVRTTLPQGPWQDLAMDFLGPLPNGDNILVVVDYFSRYFEVKFMKSITTINLIGALEDIFSIHGLPFSISSDNGPQFKSSEFKNYLENNGIVHLKKTPRWPQANGEVER